MDLEQEILTLNDKLQRLPTNWDGKECILELKKAAYNWKQMEWMGFYFELKAKELLKDICSFPGDRLDGRVEFDMKTSINYDFKSNALQASGNDIILNDTRAMDLSVENDGFHGEIIAILDVTYDDADRSFKNWHTELKGGLSDYQQRRAKEGARERRYKTHAKLVSLIYVILEAGDYPHLKINHQGRNSNDKPRPPKYMLNLGRIDLFKHWRFDLSPEV